MQRTISVCSGLIESRPHDGMLLLTMFNDEIQKSNIKKLEEFRRIKLAKHAMSIRMKAGMFWQHCETDERTDREKSVAQM